MKVQTEEQIQNAIQLLQQYGSYRNLRAAAERRSDGVSYIVRSPQEARAERERREQERKLTAE